MTQSVHLCNCSSVEAQFFSESAKLYRFLMYQLHKGPFTPSKSEKDQRINGKHKRKFSLLRLHGLNTAFVYKVGNKTVKHETTVLLIFGYHFLVLK